MVELHVRPNPAGFSDHHSRSVINKKMTVYFGARMNVDSGPAMGPFGHDPRDQRQLVSVEDMGKALDRNCFDTWIADDDLIVTVRSRISLVRSFDICLQKLTHTFDFPDKVQHDLLGPAAWALRLVQAQALKRLNPKPFDDAHYSVRCDLRDSLRRNRLFIVKTGKQNLEKVFADL